MNYETYISKRDALLLKEQEALNHLNEVRSEQRSLSQKSLRCINKSLMPDLPEFVERILQMIADGTLLPFTSSKIPFFTVDDDYPLKREQVLLAIDFLSNKLEEQDFGRCHITNDVIYSGEMWELKFSTSDHHDALSMEIEISFPDGTDALRSIFILNFETLSAHEKVSGIKLAKLYHELYEQNGLTFDPDASASRYCSIYY